MSHYKHWWYPNVEREIRQYPALKEQKNDIQATSMTPNYNGMPSGFGISRTVENAAIRQLSDREEQTINAVERAIEEVKTHKDGNEVLDVVRLVDWSQCRRNIAVAAYLLHMSEMTARRRRTRFINIVGKYLGY